jgi:glycosyltransferase involved in cell wall biosynthesis
MRIETLSAATRGISPEIPAISIALLIPAYRPGPALIEVVRSLAESGFAGIVVVDDGSGPEYTWIFDLLLEEFAAVKVIRHAVNLGKGAALKTGMNFALVEHPGLAGIVTADADGQHDPADICRVGARFAENPCALVLGARGFVGAVPLRSRLGNSITRAMMRLVVGQRLSDTQTGLRAIPRELVERMLSVRLPVTSSNWKC